MISGMVEPLDDALDHVRGEAGAGGYDTATLLEALAR